MFRVEISGADGAKTWERAQRDEAIDLARTELGKMRPPLVASVIDKTTGAEVWSATKGSDGAVIE